MTDAGGGAAAAAGDADTVYAAFEAMPTMMVALEGPDHRLVAANGIYRAFAGRQGFLGKPAREVFPDIGGQQLFELLDRVYTSGEAVIAREWRLQLEPEPGATVEVFMDFTLTPWPATDGSVRGILITQAEVTERVHERQSAQRSQRRYELARGAVAELQQALLPTGLPVLPGVRLAASYLLAGDDASAGGDWFDAVPLADGRVVLVVGDVVGHGVAASATMGQLRVVLRERIIATGDLAMALTEVDRMANDTRGARAATLCLATLDPRSGDLTYCTAGHPPPLVLTPHGEPRYLPVTGAGPLGVGAGFPTASVELAPDALVLLYTDGILERPGRDVPGSTIEFARVAADIADDRALRDETSGPVERLTTQTLELLTRMTGYDDDITLLAAGRRTPVPPLELTLTASLDALDAARTAVDEWTAAHAASREDRVALDHVVVELVTNAYEHARDAGDDVVTVTIRADLGEDGEAGLTISDNGRWQPPAPPDGRPRRGFGLAMAASLTDRLDIDSSETGTTVTVHRKFSRPARLLTDGSLAPERLEDDEPTELSMVLERIDSTASRIVVSGRLDASTVDDFGAELDRASVAGVHELVVDLTGVTHLASAAVAELHRTPPGGDGPANPLRLFAPAGSTAHHVLSLVNLPHTTVDPFPRSSADDGPVG